MRFQAFTNKELEMKEAEEKKVPGFIDFFLKVPDHRINRKKLYLVEEILLIAFCGVIAGCESWDDFELFGETKLKELREYLPFKNGTPSDDTFRRFFRALDSEKFESCFLEWVKSFQLNLKEKIVAIDGKTSCGSFDGESKAIHLISAFVSELGLTLGQLKVDGKSNEITAIPQLLEVLDLMGAIVTIDAMGCQHKIAKSILEKGADYLLGLKGNQEQLHEDVQFLFEKPAKTIEFFSTQECDKGHGRVEIRKCTVTEDIEWFKETYPQWEGLRSLVEIESTRILKDKEPSLEKRYYISSLPANPEKILNAVRQHWGIENKLHWILDVSFGDDQSRIRKGNAPRNMGIIKKTALNLLQIIKASKPRISIKKLRKLAGWDSSFLNAVLMTEVP
jgi:predicted transposase YbfD/YdcC